MDLVVGSHYRFVGDENGHAPHAVLFLGVYRPRVETVPKSASCAATDCPAYGVGGDARATRDFVDCPPFQRYWAAVNQPQAKSGQPALSKLSALADSS